MRNTSLAIVAISLGAILPAQIDPRGAQGDLTKLPPAPGLMPGAVAGIHPPENAQQNAIDEAISIICELADCIINDPNLDNAPAAEKAKKVLAALVLQDAWEDLDSSDRRERIFMGTLSRRTDGITAGNRREGTDDSYSSDDDSNIIILNDEALDANGEYHLSRGDEQRSPNGNGSQETAIAISGTLLHELQHTTQDLKLSEPPTNEQSLSGEKFHVDVRGLQGAYYDLLVEYRDCLWSDPADRHVAKVWGAAFAKESYDFQEKHIAKVGELGG